MVTDHRAAPIIPPKLHHATFLTLKGARAGRYRPENPPADVLLPEVY